MGLLSRNLGTVLVWMTMLAVPAHSAPRPIIERPDWLQKPTDEDLSKYYPERAKTENMSGKVTIACMVTAEGLLTDCTTVTEQPAGYGFGAAALALSSFFLMKPKRIDGQPVAGGKIRVPVIFAPPEDRLGDNSILIKRLGTYGSEAPGEVIVPCFDSYGQCSGHSFTWSEQPDARQSREILDRLTPNRGVTIATCTAGIDGLLQACDFKGDRSDTAMAVINAVLPLLRSPEKTDDGLPLAAATVAVPFDWEQIEQNKNQKKRP